MDKQDMGEFFGRTVLITGAAGGFGRVLTSKLLEAGANLVLGDLNEAALAELAVTLPGRIAWMRCDVTVEGDQKALVDLAVANFGCLDIAINNAGGTSPMKSFLARQNWTLTGTSR